MGITPMTARRVRLLGVVIALLAVVAGISAYVVGSEPDYRYVSADFRTVDGLYAGADVKVLGVPVGEVTSLQRHGTYVHVEMRYDAAHPLPAGVDAVLVQPSVVGDRYVQLAPAYTGGATLADHARLGVDRTQVPVTLDQTYRALDQLSAALAPNAANSKGALADLLGVAARNLKGNGAHANATVGDLSKAVTTLADNSGDLTATVDNLATLTHALAADDPQVRALATNLALVAQQLDSQRGDLTTAIGALDPALKQVAEFVRTNRGALVSSVAHLARASTAVAQQKGALDEVLRVAPLAITNLDNAYNPQNWDPAHPTTPLDARLGALQSRANFFNDLSVQLASTLQGVCGALPAPVQAGIAPVCTLLTQAGDAVGTVLQGLLGGVLGGLGSLIPASAPSTLTDVLLGGSS